MNNSFLFLTIICLMYSCSTGPLATVKGVEKEELKEEGWFEFGWMGGDDKPLLKMKLPPFMKRDYFCEQYRPLDGVHYCITSDSMLSIQGSFKEDGREVVIDLSGTAFDYGMEPRPPGKTIGSEKKSWYGGYGRKGLVDHKEIKLDGHIAYLLEINDDRENELNPRIYKYRQTTFYEFRNMFGDISISIGVKKADGKSIQGLPQKEWSARTREYLDKIIGSVKFMRKVEE